MPSTPLPLAELLATLRTAITAGRGAASARRSTLETLFLALLATILGRLEHRAHPWHNGAQSHPAPPLRMPQHSGAPHADAIALHRFPDWILRGFPARGLRPAAPPRPLPPRTRTRPVRAPPPHAQTPIRSKKPAPTAGRRITPAIMPLSQQNPA